MDSSSQDGKLKNVFLWNLNVICPGRDEKYVLKMLRKCEEPWFYTLSTKHFGDTLILFILPRRRVIPKSWKPRCWNKAGGPGSHTPGGHYLSSHPWQSERLPETTGVAKWLAARSGGGAWSAPGGSKEWHRWTQTERCRGTQSGVGRWWEPTPGTRPPSAQLWGW